MPRKRYPVRKARKARSISDQESETNVDYQTISQPDPEIQHSNSQLPTTLSSSYNPKELSCRETQKQQITKFVRSCLISDAQQGARCLYISGVPGIGKTVAVIEVIQRLKRTVHWKKAIFRYINGMALTMPSKIYYAINKQLYKPQKNDIRGNPAIKLDGKLKEDTRVKILVIDEIDYLMTKNQAILYTLFDWSNDPRTRLCLIVIANTMNFPQLLQPKITSRMGQNRLVFKPYNHNQVKTIIEQRLMKSNRFSSNAIQYACKKMASYTSDVRKLLEIFKRALEMKKEGVISLEDMVQTWKICSQQSGNIWQEYLQDHYKDIMTILKDCGGVSDEYKIHQRLQVSRNCTLKQVVLYLIEMEEMGLVRTRTKKKKILLTMEVTLLKI